MRAVQRIEEEQAPEPEHRQEMAVDRPARRRRDHEVQDRERERRDEQADGVVNPQAAERRPPGARHELGHDVAHRIREQREDQRADHVPARHVQGRKTLPKERRQELHARKPETQDRERVDDERELGPFERLADAGEHED